MVGFRIQHQESLSTVHICPYCSLLLRDPVQLTNCAHRVCQSCIDEQKGNVISCPACQDRMSREELKLDRGFRNDMQTLSINCALCSWTDTLKNYQTHLDRDHPNPACTYCNEKFISVNDLNAHQQFICKKITVNCPLQPIGCEEQIVRIELREHYSSERHQRVLLNFIHQLRRRKLQSRTSISTNELQETDKSIKILSSGSEVLSDDLKRLDVELKHGQTVLQSVIEGLSINKKSIDDQDTLFNTIRSNQETSEDDIQSVTRKLEEIKLVSIDGTYIWKIDHVHEKIAAAQSGAQTWIDSLPFSSSPTGYKMCLRLYLNGDHAARGSDLSLHFILMRGEFDAILNYPFCFKTIFCLYNQNDRRNDIVQIFRPNVASAKYGRPQSQMTVAGEISKFVSLETLRQENHSYILEDTMYIKAMIDFDNIVRDMIPYAMNLSPALTTPMQQEMIRDETEKR